MIARQLYSSSLVGVAEGIHPVDDETWDKIVSVNSDVPLIVFPRVPVLIRHVDSEPILADPTVAMLYNPDALYTRESRSERGDHYVELQLGTQTIAALEAEVPALRDGRLVATHAPAGRLVYLHQHLLARHLDSEAPDRLLVEETAQRIAHSVLSEVGEACVPRRAPTKERHRQLAEEAKEALAASLKGPTGLEELGRRLGQSPFHLARVFRQETGYSLHEYRQQLRLRLGLERLHDSTGSLTALALELGFVSHSHFTTAFRREFGLPPSAVRNGREARRILEAARPFPAVAYGANWM
jgi:AraC family transcriptional regulator